ncbi:RloB family protein [Asinibacterium sp. OR53]|uniref:RloB family protein n=1 Tax=Asinibacterium sp. OR53 TaxID=925409 RepID=UPI00047C8778|nr:RloB family protein [Asinibacterium sp. OR53]
MARKIKIPNERLKRYAREEQKRSQEIRAKRSYYLIVCEGEKTEPNYFEALKHDLPKGVLTAYRIDIEGTGRNTQSLVDEALRLKEKYESESTREVDKLWVVFDKDSFEADDFNSAIQRCTNSQPVIYCAWSNEAFELWYLLHFHYYQNAMSREQHQRLIEQNLKAFLDDTYVYEKNSEDMYILLKEHGDVLLAIKRGKQLMSNYNGRQDFAEHNSCTTVHLLVEELLNLKQNI